MWQKRQAELLREEIETVLAFLPDVTEIKTLLREPLQEPRRGLSEQDSSSALWPLLPLLTCEAVGGEIETALPVAAAIQLFMAAGDVFDDIEDADSPDSMPGRYGNALAYNAATTLIILAEKALSRLNIRGVNDATIIAALEVINSGYLTACTGQHLDLLHQNDLDISEDLYLQIAGMKSATQIQCACHAGALAGGADRILTGTFSFFGYNLGMTAQIANDIIGITQAKDINNGKITLPVIYAWTQTEGEERRLIELGYRPAISHTVEITALQDLFFRTGAIHYSMVKMELHKQLAREALEKAEISGAVIERLKIFLETNI
jgi:geranylgeranyl diphosphate synthase, type I